MLRGSQAQRLCYEKNHKCASRPRSPVPGCGPARAFSLAPCGCCSLVEPAHAAWVLFTGAAIKPVYETGSRILTRAKVQTEACRVFLEEELQLCDTDRSGRTQLPAPVRWRRACVCVFEVCVWRWGS